MIDKYKLDEIVEEDRIRLVCRDQGRSVNNSFLKIGVTAVLVFFLTIVVSYSTGPNLAVENIGPPLLVFSGLALIFVIFNWVKFSFVKELPSEIVIHRQGLRTYGKKRQKLRDIKISPQDRITISVSANRVEIYHRESLESIAWYYRSSKFSAPDIHVSNVMAVLGRDGVRPENVGSADFVHRSLGIQRSTDFLPEVNGRHKKRTYSIDKNGEKYKLKAGYKFYSVSRRGGALIVATRFQYRYGGVLNFTVKAGEISYREHLLMRVQLRPQEVVGLVSSASKIDKGGYGYNVVIPSIMILVKAKTGSTYELMGAKLEQSLDHLLAEDLYEESQRLCDEVNALFLSKEE